jgi:CHAT domain-containing protein/tetratricopeptide (TPR) repeat protein
MQGLALRALVDGIAAQSLSLADAREWVAQNRSAYVKPSLDEDLEGEARDARMKAFWEWDDRVTELSHTLDALAQQVLSKSQAPEQLITTGELTHILSGLVQGMRARMLGAYVHGRACYQEKRWGIAAQCLDEAWGLAKQLPERDEFSFGSLSYLVSALLEARRFDECIERAHELLDVARSARLRGYEALALNDLGSAHGSLGRSDEALDALRAALVLRRELSAVECKAQGVPTIAHFLERFGLSARQHGRFDEALRVFLEMREAYSENSDTHMEAVSLSEIAYTHEESGARAKAIDLLQLAIDVEAPHAPSEFLNRWQNQLYSWRGLSKPKRDESGPSAAGGGRPESVHELIAEAAALMKRGQTEQAQQLANEALAIAQSIANVDAQIASLNLLAVAASRLKRSDEATTLFHRAIALADKGGGSKVSLDLQYNLAAHLIEAGDYSLALDVVFAGIGFGENRAAQATSFGVRKAAAASATPLYELLALLVGQTGSRGNHRALMAMSENVRARNLESWTELQAHLEVSDQDRERAELRESEFKRLRRAEVELDMLHGQGRLSSAEAGALYQRVADARGRVQDLNTDRRVALDRGKEQSIYDNADRILENHIHRGEALVGLFSAPEGITFSIASRSKTELAVTGGFVEWPREVMNALLSGWKNQNAELRALRSANVPKSGDASPILALSHALEIIDSTLFKPIASVLSRLEPRKLTIIPHGPLSGLPFWRLMDRCRSVEAYTLAPSLRFVEICAGRKRADRGPTCLIGDETRTLDQSEFELSAVRVARGDSGELTRNADEFMRVSPQSVLLHVVAHGVNNSENPYHSGFLVRDMSGGKPASQYVQVVETRPPSFVFHSRPSPEAQFRAVTVADCLGELSLGKCRLAVLSSCESGVADSGAGGELLGLPNALLVAGAKTVIASLWPVDDNATAYLMSQFYRIWKGGSGKVNEPAEALAMARRALIKADRQSLRKVLGARAAIPNEPRPYGAPVYADAFQCYGAM